MKPVAPRRRLTSLPTLSRLLPSALLVGAAALISACANGPPPHAEMAASRAAVERIAVVAADAPQESGAAREKLAQAQEAFDDEDFVLARQLAEQAEADAVLAEAQSRARRSARALTERQAAAAPVRDPMLRTAEATN